MGLVILNFQGMSTVSFVTLVAIVYFVEFSYPRTQFRCREDDCELLGETTIRLSQFLLPDVPSINFRVPLSPCGEVEGIIEPCQSESDLVATISTHWSIY